MTEWCNFKVKIPPYFIEDKRETFNFALKMNHPRIDTIQVHLLLINGNNCVRFTDSIPFQMDDQWNISCEMYSIEYICARLSDEIEKKYLCKDSRINHPPYFRLQITAPNTHFYLYSELFKIFKNVDERNIYYSS